VSATRLPEPVGEAVGRYLAVADRLLPGRIVGFHVVGSVALGAYRRRRSDIDFVAVVDRRLDAGELRRLRAVHVATAVAHGAREVVRQGLSIPGVVNGVFVRADDLATPVTRITPEASHAGHQFLVRKAFDVNPVVWKTFAERGITVRGEDASTLGLDPEPDRLVAFNRDNLEGYWSRSAEAQRRGARDLKMRIDPRWRSTWCALGAPRLHHTIATGQVVSKEAAGEYALDTFAREWHPLLLDALAYWREEPSPDDSLADRRRRARVSADFVLAVVDHARSLPAWTS
jgi:hypothetical protein